MIETVNDLVTRPIQDLLDENFIIPSYQRGFRWTTQQVEDLLTDVLDFSINSDKEEFYCLQPIVIKLNDNSYEVIDGQQRLTTIFIILNYFNQRLAEDFKKDLFTLKYETRSESEAFLKNMALEDRNENIDFYFMSNAYETIKDWFKTRQNFIGDFESTLLNKVEVIWYEVKEENQEIDIFTRLNMGKIPLTNAELIKALFLRKENFSPEDNKVDYATIYLKQLEIANQWDAIQKTLETDSFWFFIKDNDVEYDTRIEFIFDKMVRKQLGHDEYFTFQEFNKKFKDGYDANIWEEVKSYFLSLEEWYSNDELYHLIGFLIQTGTKINDLLDLKIATNSKRKFKAALKKLIIENLPKDTDAVEYGKKNHLTKNALLLFNVQTILNNPKANLRFPFNNYVKQKWDIEHIRSVNNDLPSKNKRKEWVQELIDFLNSEGEKLFSERKEEREALKLKLNNILDDTASDRFNLVYNDVLEFFNEQADDELTNSIGNLTLLDSKTNRSYKNAVFPIKRKRIISNDKKGTFVPIATKNVFLKFYSKKSSNLFFWEEYDIIDYREEIKQTLSQYIPIKLQIEEDDSIEE